MSTFRSDLIYDIGMHDGKDTAYYLHRGFKVVAVDANPQMCERAAERFKSEISAGRLRIENIAIHESEGIRPFYISKIDEWSSFDVSIASRDGTSYVSIPIQCTPFATLLDRYGVPYYLKIDIEGADNYCLQSLSSACLPTYISKECGPHLLSDIQPLHELGYKRFKLINQRNLLAYPEFLKEPSRQHLFRRLRQKWKNVRAKRWRNDWYFELGSSGPFGEDADGPWLSFQQVVDQRERWLKAAPPHIREWEFWYDLHAAH